MPDGFRGLLETNLRQFALLSPEVMLVFTFLAALLFDLAVTHERKRSTGYICILGTLVALWLSVIQNTEFLKTLASVPITHPLTSLSKQTFGGMFTHDLFSTFFRILLLLGTGITLLLAIHSKELKGKHQGEFFLLVLAVCLGGMFLASTTHLLMIYVALEAVSIVSYALTGFLRKDRKSAEAGIKYAVYGAMASGIMLFGMSYLYGLTGTLHILDHAGQPGIVSQLQHLNAHSHQAHVAVLALLIMVFMGFLYKIAAVPFHYWAPDVYEGAPTAATAFFSVVPKAAGFAVLIRCLFAFFPTDSHTPWLKQIDVQHVIAVLAVATMTLGNLAALGQINVKRMLAFSSIAHAGYMLAGLSVLNVLHSTSSESLGGPASVLFYLVVYLFMNLGAFGVLMALENRFGGSDISHLRGAVRHEPLLIITLCICLFSLVGLPPFAGFTAKYLIMVELADRKHFMMVLCIGLNSVISLYYYMKIAKAVAIDADESPSNVNANATNTLSNESTLSYKLIGLGCSFILLLLFVRFESILHLCQQVMEPLR